MKPSNRPGVALISEAALAMVVATIALNLLPFRRLAGKLARSLPQARSDPDETERVQRAITAWARRVPYPPKCFVRGLTAHWMLRRRGLASTLYYGAATIDGVLKAHVWVRSGDVDVTGCENASDYALLASFPDR